MTNLLTQFCKDLKQQFKLPYTWEEICIQNVVNGRKHRYYHALPRGSGKSTFSCWLAKEVALHCPGSNILILTHHINSVSTDLIFDCDHQTVYNRKDKHLTVCLRATPVSTIDIVESVDCDKLRGHKFDLIIEDDARLTKDYEECVVPLLLTPSRLHSAVPFYPKQIILYTPDDMDNITCNITEMQTPNVANIL